MLFPTTIFHARLESAARAQLTKELNGGKHTENALGTVEAMFKSTASY
jgi:hypothetical protein